MPDQSQGGILLKLVRTDKSEAGIFGELLDEAGNLIAVTLEHAYLVGGEWTAKIPPDTYVCGRGLHKLHGMTNFFETFQILEVPNCTNILFHWGNYNKDSEGCVLLGSARSVDMITHSRATWTVFMQMLEGERTFTLEVSA